MASLLDLTKNLFSRDKPKKANPIIQFMDRDKSMPGFQAVRGGWKGAKARVKATPISRYSVFSPKNAGRSVQAISSYKTPGMKMSIGQAAQKTFPTVSQDFSRDISRIPFTNKQFTPLQNTARAISGGATSFAKGIYDYSQNKPIRGLLGTVKGIGQTAAAGTPFFQGANIVSSLPQGKLTDKPVRAATGVIRGMTQLGDLSAGVKEKKSLNIPLIGEIDPLMTVGSMVGFVKNPANKELFKFTETLFPTTSKGLINWLGTTAIRGSLEQVILDYPDSPENMSEQEKVKWVVSTIGTGAIQEILGQALFKGLGKGSEVISGSKDFKALVGLFDNLSQVVRKAGIPVKSTEFNPSTRTWDNITRPMFIQQLVDKGHLPGKFEGQTGFARLGKAPKPPDKLAIEAQKYKSAEEFVKAHKGNKLALDSSGDLGEVDAVYKGNVAIFNEKTNTSSILSIDEANNLLEKQSIFKGDASKAKHQIIDTQQQIKQARQEFINIKGFAEDKTALQKGKITKDLNQQRWVNGELLTNKDWIDNSIKNGYEITSSGIMRKKGTDAGFKLNKTEADYARHLTDIYNQAKGTIRRIGLDL